MKKFLSLVLALAMTLSLVTISAGAKDFADESDIDYDAAVDVISELGIVSGYGDNSFRPDGLLTRGAAAKIICNLILGPTTAGALQAGTAPFKDVPTTNTFAGYITYCAQQGIISGYGDGTFRPSGSLTGNAFMKMLLGALGYSSSIEGYTGANWQVNVVKQAIGIGLDDGNDSFVGSNPVTRGEAALYAFNMLQATMVEYDSTSTIVVGDITINTSSSRKEVENSVSRNNTIEDDGKMQFAERYFPDLEKVPGRSDDYGRPATTWELDNDVIGTYADEADEVYTEEVKTGDIYSDLGLDKDIAARNVDLYQNGKDGASADTHAIERRGDDKFGGQGVTTEVFYDKNAGTVVISEISTYLGIVVDDDYSKDGDDGVLVDVYGSAAGTYFVKNANYDMDTVLLVQVADGEIQEIIGEPETVTTDLTRVVASDDAVIAGGTEYPKAAEFTTADDDVIKGVAASALEPDEDISYVLYLDQYGNYIAVEEDENNAPSDLVYVSHKYKGSVMDGRRVRYAAMAEIIRMDGTVENVAVGKTYAASDDSGIDTDLGAITENAFAEMSYDEDDDVYTLTTTLDGYTTGTVADDLTLEEDDSVAKMADGSNTNYYLDGSTTYIFFTKDGDFVDDVEVVVGGVNYTTVDAAGDFVYNSRRNVDYVVIPHSYDADSDNVIYFGDAKEDGKEHNGYVFAGYLVGESKDEDYVVYSVDENADGTAEWVEDSLDGKSLNGFYKFKERSNGSLALTKLPYTANTSYDPDVSAYLHTTLNGEYNGIRNGILEWGTNSSTALISGAVVVDLTDADDPDENTYGRNVTSVATLERLLGNYTDAANDYGITVDMYANKSNEIEAVFITKIENGPGISGGGSEDDSEYAFTPNSFDVNEGTTTGSVKVTLGGATVIKGSTPKALADLTVTAVAYARDTDQNWVDVTDGGVELAASTDGSGVLSINSNSTSAEFALALTSGSYRVTLTLTGEDVGTLSLGSYTVAIS